MLGKNQRDTLFFYLETIKSVLAESHQQASLSALKEKLDIALAMLERDFPISIQVCIF